MKNPLNYLRWLFGSRARRRALIGSATVMILLLLGWGQASAWYRQQMLDELKTAVTSETANYGNALTLSINRRLTRLQGLYAYVQTEGNSPTFGVKFQSFASSLYAGSYGIRNFAIAPEGVVQYVYPTTGNSVVIGYDPLLDSRQEVRAAARRAMLTRQVTLTGPVDLLQGGSGLIARQAVYHGDEYWGLVNMVVDLQPLLIEAGLDQSGANLQLAIRDASWRVFYGSPELFTQSPVLVEILLPEGQWVMAGLPASGWDEPIRQPLLIFRSTGLIILALVTAVTYLTISRQVQLAQAVSRRTRELSNLNLSLERRVAERTRELSTLLDISREISSTLELSPLLKAILSRLKRVVDYNSGVIMTREKEHFTISAYSPERLSAEVLERQYRADNIFGDTILERQKPIIITDILATTPINDALRQIMGPEIENLGELRSWLAVPLVVKKEVIGVLALQHRERAFYTEAHAELVMAFANQMAVAIENARLYEKAQTLAALEERQRLARELHDSVSQVLYGIGMGARTAITVAERENETGRLKETLREPLDYILSLAEAGLAEMRALIFELRPESLKAEGLVAALSKQAAAIQGRHKLEVTANFCQEPAISLPAKEALYRVAQEALNNIVKHARADTATVELTSRDGTIILSVSDNGAGFDTKADYPGHLGLQTMKERINRLGGSVQIESAPGQGSRVVAELPIV